MRATIHAIAFLPVLVAMTGSTWAADQVVTIENFTFKPATITIHAGTAVIFKNGDDIPHSVVVADGSYHSAALDTDEEVSVPFAKVGEYAYFCGLHPHMQGKVTVVP